MKTSTSKSSRWCCAPGRWRSRTLAHAAEDFKGNWTIMPSSEAGKVHFGLMHRHDGGNSNHESDWPTSAFQGLDLTRSRQTRRELHHHSRRGPVHLRRLPQRRRRRRHLPLRAGRADIAAAMSALGFAGIDDDKQFAMAVHDVSLDFAKAIKAERLTTWTPTSSSRSGIFDVTPAVHPRDARGRLAGDATRQAGRVPRSMA